MGSRAAVQPLHARAIDYNYNYWLAGDAARLEKDPDIGIAASIHEHPLSPDLTSHKLQNG